MLVDASTDANTKTHTQTACAHRLRIIINNNNDGINNAYSFYSHGAVRSKFMSLRGLYSGERFV